MKEFYFKYLHDFVYSVFYSIKDLFVQLKDIIDILKKPYTWSIILFFVLIYALFTNNMRLFNLLIPLVLLVYYVRQIHEGKYKNEIKRKALINNNDIILKDIYNKYRKDCSFVKPKPIEPLEYSAWKEIEKNKLN